jgi:hypothetical protein
MKRQIHGARLLFSAGIAVTLAISMLAGGGTASAAGPTSVDLGTADGFAVLAGTGITNTGATTITGDVGSYPTTSQTGFGSVVLTGTNRHGGAVTQTAQADLVTAYDAAFGRKPVTQTIHILGGKKLVGGVYNAGGSTMDLTKTLTLDGQNDPSSVWIFQATSDLITASSSSVVFINGAQPCNVFWQVHSSATLGSGSSFAGTIMALTSITLASGVTVDGRVLARNGDVTLINDTITRSTCAAVTPSGSSTATATSTASPSTRASATPPTTSTANRPVRGDSMPILALLTCLALGGLGVAAVEAQRRRIRR